MAVALAPGAASALLKNTVPRMFATPPIAMKIRPLEVEAAHVALLISALQGSAGGESVSQRRAAAARSAGGRLLWARTLVKPELSGRESTHELTME